MTKQVQNLTRAKSIKEWQQRSQKIVAPLMAESIQYALDYQAQSTDVFITPFRKCGTTWLQQIVHCLRTRGDMNFTDMLEVMPWLEMAHWLGQDLYAPQQASFQAFKCHFSWDGIPKGGRYILSFRNPKDALISDYNFINGYSWEKGTVSLEDYATFFLNNRIGDGAWDGSYWAHLVSWWKQRDNPQVLLLSYEDMRKDLPTTLNKIANFLNIELDKNLQDITIKHTSKDFMLAHKSKFSGLLLQTALEKVAYSPASEDCTMVTKGHKTKLPANICSIMDNIWNEQVEKKIGIPSYSALQNNLKTLNS